MPYHWVSSLPFSSPRTKGPQFTQSSQCSVMLGSQHFYFNFRFSYCLLSIFLCFSPNNLILDYHNIMLFSVSLHWRRTSSRDSTDDVNGVLRFSFCFASISSDKSFPNESSWAICKSILQIQRIALLSIFPGKISSNKIDDLHKQKRSAASIGTLSTWRSVCLEFVLDSWICDNSRRW